MTTAHKTLHVALLVTLALCAAPAAAATFMFDGTFTNRSVDGDASSILTNYDFALPVTWSATLVSDEEPTGAAYQNLISTFDIRIGDKTIAGARTDPGVNTSVLRSHGTTLFQIQLGPGFAGADPSQLTSFQLNFDTRTQFAPLDSQSYLDAPLISVMDFSRPAANGNGYVGVSYDGRSLTSAQVTGSMTVLGIPEPSTWAAMILGFGLAGSVLRRRRVSVA